MGFEAFLETVSIEISNYIARFDVQHTLVQSLRYRDPNRPDDRLTGADIRLISGLRSDRMSSHRPTPPFGRIFQLLWGSGANRKVMVIVGFDRMIPADPRLTVVDTCG
jgi:hypothetical protein